MDFPSFISEKAECQVVHKVNKTVLIKPPERWIGEGAEHHMFHWWKSYRRVQDRKDDGFNESLNSDHDRNACVLSQHPKHANNKVLQLASSQAPHIANI